MEPLTAAMTADALGELRIMLRTWSVPGASGQPQAVMLALRRRARACHLLPETDKAALGALLQSGCSGFWGAPAVSSYSL